VDPEGRVLQAAGERETILTEVIDLNAVQKVRNYGTLGLSHLWKDFGSFGRAFPIYQPGMRKGKVFKPLDKPSQAASRNRGDRRTR